MKAVLHPEAAKYLRRIGEPNKSRLQKAVKRLEKEPPEGNIIPLAGQDGTYRLKVGGYRVLFRMVTDAVLVTHIVPRGQAYGKKTGGGRR